MTNHLIKEASPYLQMHAKNPVDWYPWNKEALKNAKQENKPILLSIGYSACHWCHVMAHESFEDQATAELMNKYFINIKVDREERPDIDKIYQISAQLLTRQAGGWPLTIFLMPENQIPFFAGTYFPKERRGQYPAFKEVLQYINDIYAHHQPELIKQTISFQGILTELETQGKFQSDSINPSPIHRGIDALKTSYDAAHGGFGTAPKFPMTTSLELLFLNAVAGDTHSTKMLFYSLQKMCQGGIYDQVGGGFFRYSVDEKWQIPHFEKMLYDNAQLLSLLAQTYGFFSKNFLCEAAEETADWMVREMQAIDGGYYATLAADTQGQEGKFYLWSNQEIESLLNKEEYQIINLFYGLFHHPNFKNLRHLQVHTPIDEIATSLNKSKDQVITSIKLINRKLFSRRLTRLSPQRDEKIITSWNGLAIKAMTLAGIYLQNQKYINSADRCIQFIMKNLWSDGKLYSVFKDGQRIQYANLDDYVFLIEGILHYLQAKWHVDYFIFLKHLVEAACAEFEDAESGGFYFTSINHEKLIYRVKQYTDESLPSSSAVFTKILLQLGYLLGETKLLTSAEKSFKNAFAHLKKFPSSYCSFLISLIIYFDTPKILVVRGVENCLADWKRVFRANYHPNYLSFFITPDLSLPAPLDSKIAEKDTVAYFCHGSECRPPIQNLQDFEHEFRSNQFRIAR